jgi:hypothetical protein
MTRLEARTDVPRVHPFGWKEMVALSRQLVQHDPSVVDRAKEVLRAGLPTMPPGPLERVKHKHRLRRYSSALQLLSALGDANSLPALEKGIVDIADWFGQPKHGQDDPDLASEVFPVLCQAKPTAALDAAVAWYVAGDSKLLAQGLSFSTFLSTAIERRKELSTTLKRCKTEVNSPEVKLVIMALIGDDKLPGLFTQDLSLSNEDAVLAWISPKLRDSAIVAVVNGRLRSANSGPQVIESIIRALTYTDTNGLFWDPVYDYATRAARDPRHVEGLAACLDYFARLPMRASLRPLLLELLTYPSRSEIRDAAHRLLGR